MVKIIPSEKQQILETVNTLSDDATWDDAICTLYIHSKLAKSQDDIKNGRVMTIEESKERMRKNMQILMSNESHEDIDSIFEYISLCSS